MIKFGLLSLVLVTIISLTLSQGQAPQKTCRQVFSDMNRRQLKWINDCIKQLGYKTAREKTEKSACVMKCVLENLQMLNSEGILDQEQFDKFVTTQWPEHMHTRANMTFQTCLKVKLVDTGPTDEYCKRIEPITKCLTRNFSNLCKGT